MPPSKHLIYIVDDDDDDREAIRDAFIENRHLQNFICLKDADELFRNLNNISSSAYPSLILLDLNMPGKDGRTVLREIKADKNLQHIPVVVLTTSSSSKEKTLVYKMGANCFVTKPDSFTKLLTVTDSIAKLWLVNP